MKGAKTKANKDEKSKAITLGSKKTVKTKSFQKACGWGYSPEKSRPPFRGSPRGMCSVYDNRAADRAINKIAQKS